MLRLDRARGQEGGAEMTSQAALLDREPLIEVGRGTRRVCYRLGTSGLCVKFYWPPEECVPARMKPSVIRDVARRRFDEKANSSAMEVRYYADYWMKMPEDVRTALLPHVERVFHPQWGYGVLETYYTGSNGLALLPYEFEMLRQPDLEVRRTIYRAARDLLRALIREGAYFYEPGNFHVLFGADGRIALKIVDFEPEAKTVFAAERWWPWFRRLKLKRKARRYLAHIRTFCSVHLKPETEIG